MKTPMLCLLPSIAVAAMVVAQGPGQVAQKPDVDFIAAALSQQEASCGPSLDVRYTVDGLTPREGDRLHAEIRYLRTPKALFKEVRYGKRTVSGDFKVEWNHRLRYDRASGQFKSLSVAPSGSPRIGYVLTDLGIPSRFVGTGILDPALYWLPPGPLLKVIREGSVADTQEEIDGHLCWRVDVPLRQVGTSQSESYSVWLDSDIGFCPRRLTKTVLERSGELSVIVSDFSGYRLLGDQVYFPMRLIVKYDEAGTKGLQFEVQEAACNKEVLSEELAVTFPSGTNVHVLDENAEYVQP